jgi:hypothetical protein
LHHDVSTQIIRNLGTDDSSLYSLPLVSKAICVFIEVKKDTLFSPKAITRKATYHNIVKIFKSMQKYLELPIFSGDEVNRAKNQLNSLSHLYQSP